MKYIFTFIFSLFIVSVIFTQSSFSRIYEMENFESDKIQQILRIENQLILIIASTCEIVQGGNCLSIISTDLDGEELWRIEKPTHKIEDNMNIAFLWNNYIYVAAQDLTTATSDQPGQIQAFQIGLDGNIVDTHVVFFSVPESFRFDGIIANGDIFTVCSTLRLNDDQTQAKFSFFDPDFDWQGQRILSSAITNLGFQDLKPAHDGGYILASVTFTTGIGFQRKIQKLTAHGTTQWERILEPSEFYTDTSVETNENGDIFIIYERNQGFFTNPEVYLHVERIDSTGNIIWVNEHYIAGAEDRDYERMYLTNENEIIYIGSGEAMGVDNGYSGFAAKINSEGDLVWEKAYRDADLGSRQTNLFHGVVLDNGEIIMGGELRNTIDIFREDPWLLRTNADGCVYTETCGDLQLVTPTNDLAANPSKPFYITPTLVQNQLTIRLKNEVDMSLFKFQIVTTSGQVFYEDISRVFPITVETTQLPAGFYFLKIEENGKTMFQDKFIVARY